jgi:DNA-binding LacI/PurR family transcriptional regulator
MATLRDVAQAAGVSVVTASRALNGASSVRDSSRARVSAAAARLGYRPNLLAQGLSRQRMNLVIVHMGELDNPYFGRLAETLIDAFNAVGQDVILANTAKKAMDVGDTLSAAGRVLVCVGNEELLRKLAATGRTVGIACRLPDGQEPGFPNLNIAYDNAYAEILDALLAAGKRKFAFISPFARRHEFLLDVKFGGLLAAMKRARLRPVAPPGTRAFPSVAALVAAMDFQPGLTDAVFCENDLFALDLYMELRRFSRRGPWPVVIGCDGILDLPGIWTVRIDVHALAAATVAAFQRFPDTASPPALEAVPVLRRH